MEFFLARQPIFDEKQRVYAYELLYRVGYNNFYANSDGDKATSEVVSNSFLLLGLETLTGGKRAFINFTKNLLQNGMPTILPKQLIAVEILEDVERSQEIISICKKLKQMGYMLVLDDYIDDVDEPLLKLVEIIKVDFLKTPLKERKDIVRRHRNLQVKFLAEKVETREDFEQAVKWGYTYFQGYFFSKPVILSGRDVPAYKDSYLKILQETNKAEPNFDRIESIISRDVSLSYKMLKYINSAAYGFINKIRSLRQALVMLGMAEIKKWVSLVALKAMAEDKPDEIVKSSVVRARFGELLAPKVGMADLSSEFFLMGLFSMIDALMDRPLADIITDLPIWPDIKDALIGKQGIYRDVYELILAYEKGDWNTFCDLANKLNLNVNEVPQLFIESLDWADQMFN